MRTQMFWRLTALAAMALFMAVSAQSQSAPATSVADAVLQPLTLTTGDLAAMPRANITMRNNGIETARGARPVRLLTKIEVVQVRK